MLTTEIIAKKRDGLELSKEDIETFIEGYARGDIPDYQAAAWLMAVYLNGMSRREVIDLTEAMARSGEMLDLSDVAPFVVDKHSTGGVGDKTTLVVAPLVASLGVPVAKMSGRGLGFTGGTIDKLESIPGFRCDLSPEAFREHLQRYGIVLSGQTMNLAPADGKLYALRDVTATVSSLPLIASSIMSKKLAAGAHGIVLDVKVGCGAFMKDQGQAEELARMMMDIGRDSGRRMAAVISNMDQPLGDAVGNALEVREAVQTLRREGPTDFLEHCLVVAAQMLLVGGRVTSPGAAREELERALNKGEALEKFRQWVEVQGGDPRVADAPDTVLPQAPLKATVRASLSGWVAALDALEIGWCAMRLGAGRAVKGQEVNHAVGLVFHRKLGDEVRRGDRLCTIHASSEGQIAEARASIAAAYRFSDEPVEVPELILRVL